MRRRSRVLRGALALLLLAGGACSAQAGRDPLDADPAFYRPPEPLPAGRPGDVLRAQELDGLGGSGRAWRVLYRSESLSGEPVAVSGIVAAPEGEPPAGGWPVLSIAHGTVGLADRCAPSIRPGTTVTEATSRGLVVVATDYEGLGPPGPHPYLVGESAARSVIDAVRAARAMGPEVGAGSHYAVLGFSQGGHAALFANEIAAAWAPELELVGAAAGAPPVEMPAFMEHLVVTGQDWLIASILEGFSAVDPALDPAAHLAPAARELLPVVERRCSLEVLERFTEAGSGLVDPDVATSPDVARLLVADTPSRAGAAPVLVVHGTADTLVPPTLIDAAVARLCAAGQAVERRDYPGVDHVGIIEASFFDAAGWLLDRFQGRPLGPTCA